MSLNNNSFFLSFTIVKVRLRKHLHRKNTNVSDVIISVLTSKEFQDSNMKIVLRVGMKFALRDSIKTSMFIILNECNFQL